MTAALRRMFHLAVAQNEPCLMGCVGMTVMGTAFKMSRKAAVNSSEGTEPARWEVMNGKFNIWQLM